MQKQFLYGDDVNLELLSNEFRRGGQAKRGYVLLRPLIRTQKRKKLDNLLRDHRKKAIYKDKEIDGRECVDQLIGFYSLVTVGLIAGRISQPLPKALCDEVKMILGDPSVRAYYKEFYPLLLPDLLYQLVIGNIASLPSPGSVYKFSTVEAGVRFDEFLMLIRAIEGDAEVDVFLGMLDDYWYDEQGLPDLIELLGSSERLEKVVRRKRQSNDLDKAAKGCIRYLRLLQEFHELLQRTGRNNPLAGAMWLHQGYWLIQMRQNFDRQLGRIVRNIGRSLEAAANKPIAGRVEKVPARQQQQLEQGARDTLGMMATSIKALLDPSWGTPLIASTRKAVVIKRLNHTLSQS